MKYLYKGYLLIIIGILIISTEYYSERKIKVIEHNKIESTVNNSLGYREYKDTYDMILEIPQIKLKKGIYKKSDKRNNIEKNVTIHEYSNYPNEVNSNLILMAHSGTGSKAYFNDIDKLTTDSLIKIYYEGIKYTYKINNHYEINKNGTAEIKRNKNKKTITLITCSRKNKSKQLIYIGYLIDEL